jgi:two-component system, cell cycle sensor histidine kinase and response regulator CckA
MNSSMSGNPVFESFPRTKQRSAFRPRVWFTLGAILVFALPIFGFWRIRYLKRSALAYWEGQLSSVADVTIFAIREWTRERESELRTLSALIDQHPELFEPGARAVSAGERSRVHKILEESLDLIKQQGGYSGVWAIDAAGRTVLTSREGSLPEEGLRNVAIQAAKEGRRQIIGPLFDAHGVPTLIFAYPTPPLATNAPDPGQRHYGAVLLTVDPSKFLFPLISVDPMTTKTGEYILVAKIDNRFEVLSPLRHPPTPALSVRIPWDKAPILNRMSIEQESAFGEFTDFRGIQVIAVTRHISGSVGLIRQIDQSEAYAAYRTQIRTELLLALAVFASVALAFVTFERAEHASRLREVAASEARLAAIINSAMDAIIALDADQRVALFNPAAERMFRCDSAEALGQPGGKFLPERFRKVYWSKIDKFSRSGETALAVSKDANLMGLRGDGEEFPLEASVSKLEVEGHKIILAIIRDITERRRAEELLRNTEEKYRRLFEESRDVVFISTAEGKFLDINPAGVELFGYDSREELLQVDIASTLYANPRDRDAVRKAHELQGFIKDYEIVLKRKDGQKRVVLETSNPVRDENGNIVAFRGFLRDITERKTLERQLLESQKMEAVGLLAGGIAHDFNNILTAILGYSELLQSECPPGDPRRRDIDEITRSATRAATLTRQLLAFSRRQVMQSRVLGLNSVVAEMNKMLGRIITENIQLCTILDPGLAKVRVDPAQIEQVILNLVVNAKDAMLDGGKLTIETANVDLPEAMPAQPLDVPAGRYVTVSVGDTGHGIDPEVQGRIFEPFFTTKEIGKGTGLGLSTVYGIVKQSGGYISVPSVPGSGTTFRIFLPRIDAAEAADEYVGVPAGSLDGSETILLVEDEASVRKLSRDVLTRHKYKVIEADNGEQAIALSTSFRDAIHLMITDMVMPEMGGRELARRLASVHPETQVLFVSGYAETEVGKGNLSEQGKRFLAKPFTPLDLVRTVRRMLDEDNPGAD